MCVIIWSDPGKEESFLSVNSKNTRPPTLHLHQKITLGFYRKKFKFKSVFKKITRNIK
jgi:hypothetical protein